MSILNLNPLGIHLRLLVGETLARPADPFLAECLRKVQVTTSDKERSGFQLTFHVGRVGAFDLMDFRLVKNSQLQPFNRVVLAVVFNARLHPLIDGVITARELSPSAEPGASTLTVTGEDVSVMLDLEQDAQQFPNRKHREIVEELLGKPKYSKYITTRDLRPSLKIEPAPDKDKKNTTKPTNMTDHAYISELAKRNGYVFYVEPLKAPNTNRAYWGPPVRLDAPQRALNVNMGPHTNVESIKFSYKALAPKMLVVPLKDKKEPQTLESYTREPPLVSNTAKPRVKKFYARPDGYEDAQALSEAQGQVNSSFDEVVTATGTLNALSYGAPLRPRTLVGLRGAGKSFDGLYYVKQVTHNLSKGEYKQDFTLTREGTHPLSPSFLLPG